MKGVFKRIGGCTHTFLKRFHESRVLDFVFVVYALDWVLYGICKDIGQELTTKGYNFEIVKWPGPIPHAKSYFLSHHSLAGDRWLRALLPGDSRVIAWFTHYRSAHRIDRLVTYLNTCDKVLVMNSASGAQLISDGLALSKVSLELGYADPKKFYPEQHGERIAIGFVSNFLDNQHYRARKNYEKMFELIRLLCSRYDVILVGRGFRTSEFAGVITACQRLQYVEAEHSGYKDYYNSMRVFVSVSRLEGGPLALLESMMCDCYPVTTCTGFAPDLISHGENGFIIPNADNMTATLDYIDRAYDMQPNASVSKSVQEHTIESFASRLVV